MARLFLVDGMSHIYRAYFAIRGLTNREGMSTNAVYGFTMILIKAIKDLKPNYIAATFDHRDKTFRHQEYDQYPEHDDRKEITDEIGLLNDMVVEIHNE